MEGPAFLRQKNTNKVQQLGFEHVLIITCYTWRCKQPQVGHGCKRCSITTAGTMWLQPESLWLQGGLLVGFSTTDSSTQQRSSALLMMPECFSFIQDGELVLEHSTPCWTF